MTKTAAILILVFILIGLLIYRLSSSPTVSSDNPDQPVSSEPAPKYKTIGFLYHKESSWKTFQNQIVKFKKLDGVYHVVRTEGEKSMEVTYDPKKLTEKQLIEHATNGESFGTYRVELK